MNMKISRQSLLSANQKQLLGGLGTVIILILIIRAIFLFYQYLKFIYLREKGKKNPENYLKIKTLNP